jgi:hypothetical protein
MLTGDTKLIQASATAATLALILLPPVYRHILLLPIPCIWPDLSNLIYALCMWHMNDYQADGMSLPDV